MENEKQFCPIWGTPVKDSRGDAFEDAIIVSESPRAGGDYRITAQASRDVEALDPTEKAKLTTILIELRRAGNHAPLVTLDLIDEAKRAEPLPVYTRAERLLRYLVNIQKPIGEPFVTQIITDGLESLAWSESTSPIETDFLVDYLRTRGWLIRHSSGYCTITVDGYQHVAEQATKRDLSQCFVAMWFDDSMKQAYEEGIKKAVEECGYKPFRIDQKQHLNKIDDEIIAEIRRSRFVVADFTHYAEKGVRGSVYYEAGFAYGLGLPVLYSCREDLKNELHFDTRQYPHILWKTPEDLYTKLRDKIGAIIGDYKAEPAPAIL